MSDETENMHDIDAFHARNAGKWSFFGFWRILARWALKYRNIHSRRAISQGDPLRVRRLRRAQVALRGVPPHVQRRHQDRSEGEAKDKVQANRARVSKIEGIRPPHSLHSIGVRSRVFGVQEPEAKVRPLRQEEFYQAGQSDIHSQSSHS